MALVSTVALPLRCTALSCRK